MPGIEVGEHVLDRAARVVGRPEPAFGLDRLGGIHECLEVGLTALEELGVEVDRYSLRASDDPLSDPADLAELERTRVVLDARAAGLLLGNDVIFRIEGGALRVGQN